MKVCGLCNRVYPDSASVCESDGERLTFVRREDTTAGAPVIDWEGPLAGDIVGKYRLESMIAEGGMGRIFKATHLSLARPVAIKFLLPEHAARADLVQRFFNEARSVNAIRHPHIVDIFDYVQERQPDGPALVYMVMEYLDGEDARTRLQGGPFDPSSVIYVAVQVAEALATAHEAGILHRDLKPDNIFLCATPPDFVKLLDFGAAKAFGERPGHDLTRPGVAIGTPEYMAPEQILNRTLDSRVDEYALGIVCYELLVGNVPFQSPKLANVLAAHTKQEPTPLHHLNPDVPPALEDIVMRCLRKSPDERFTDLWAVADALRAAAAELGGKTLVLSPPRAARAPAIDHGEPARSSPGPAEPARSSPGPAERAEEASRPAPEPPGVQPEQKKDLLDLMFSEEVPSESGEFTGVEPYPDGKRRTPWIMMLIAGVILLAAAAVLMFLFVL